MEDYEFHLLNSGTVGIISIPRNTICEANFAKTFNNLYNKNNKLDESDSEINDKPKLKRKAKDTYYGMGYTEKIGNYSIAIRRSTISLGKYDAMGKLYVFKMLHEKTCNKLWTVLIDHISNKLTITDAILTDIMKLNSYLILKVVADFRKKCIEDGIYGVDSYATTYKSLKLFNEFKLSLINDVDEWTSRQFMFLMNQENLIT